MGSIKNTTDLFLKAVFAEQEAGLGEAIGFFDIEFSPVFLGRSGTRRARQSSLAIRTTMLYL